MRALLLVLVLLLPPAALAGQDCETHAVTPEQLREALRLGAQVQAAMDRAGADAAVLGRIGSDVSRHGLRWTHAGLAWRRAPGAPIGLLHALNHCGADTSDLFEQGLANFFLDDPHELRALLVVPDRAMQQRLVAAATTGAGPRVHGARYSLIAYPFATEFQNSNQWLLEFIAAADGGAPDRPAAQAYLAHHGYAPSVIRIGPGERLGASLLKRNVAFFDHPTRERLSGRYSIVSVESIVAWLQAQGRVASVQELW